MSHEPFYIAYDYPLDYFTEYYVLQEYFYAEDIFSVKAAKFIWSGPDQWFLEFTSSAGSFRLVGADYIEKDHIAAFFDGYLKDSDQGDLTNYQLVPKIVYRRDESPYVAEIMMDQALLSYIPETDFFQNRGMVSVNKHTKRSTPYKYYPLFTDQFALFKKAGSSDTHRSVVNH